MLVRDLIKLPGIYLDDADATRLSLLKAYIDDQHRIVICLGSRRSEQFLHRYLMPTAAYVDHINGNSCDNRRSNLRECTLTQNQGNRKNQINNTSGYKGVSFSKQAKGWKARVNYAKKEYYCGVWSTKELAAEAYNRKASELFGEFAKLNEVMYETN